MRRIFIPTLAAAILFTAIHFVRTAAQTAGQNYAADSAPYYLTAAQLGGPDNGADLIVSNHNSGNLSILRNKGDGTFQPATNLAVGKAPTAVIRSRSKSPLPKRPARWPPPISTAMAATI
ncbi:MAG: hypothetical protein HYR56_18130 [Acidobacteria bacterium]|nr:hypothetical protein [Acidobacteriota bacterium]